MGHSAEGFAVYIAFEGAGGGETCEDKMQGEDDGETNDEKAGVDGICGHANECEAHGATEIRI